MLALIIRGWLADWSLLRCEGVGGPGVRLTVPIFRGYGVIVYGLGGLEDGVRLKNKAWHFG